MEKGKAYATVDDYIDARPAPVRKKLTQLRRVVKEEASDAEERLSYRMPAYFLNGNVIYFAAHTNHIGFYPGAAAVALFKKNITKYKNAKGSIQFPIAEPLPMDLIRKIIRFKAKANLKKTSRRSPE